jgi:hypothetical protein
MHPATSYETDVASVLVRVLVARSPPPTLGIRTPSVGWRCRDRPPSGTVRSFASRPVPTLGAVADQPASPGERVRQTLVGSTSQAPPEQREATNDTSCAPMHRAVSAHGLDLRPDRHFGVMSPLGCDRAVGDRARWRSVLLAWFQRPKTRVIRRTCRRAGLAPPLPDQAERSVCLLALERGYVSARWGWGLAWAKATSWPVSSSQSLRLTARRPSRIETVGTPAKITLVSWARCRL